VASLSLLERYRGEITLPFGNGVNGFLLGAHFLFEGEQATICEAVVARVPRRNVIQCCSAGNV